MFVGLVFGFFLLTEHVCDSFAQQMESWRLFWLFNYETLSFKLWLSYFTLISWKSILLVPRRSTVNQLVSIRVLVNYWLWYYSRILWLCYRPFSSWNNVPGFLFGYDCLIPILFTKDVLTFLVINFALQNLCHLFCFLYPVLQAVFLSIKFVWRNECLT